MDPLLKVTDAPRNVPPGVSAETPLITIAWRAARAEHERRTDERLRAETEAHRIRDALAHLAEDTFRLSQLAGRLKARSDKASGPDNAAELCSLVERLRRTLAEAEIEIIAPEGATYAGPLMGVLENVAQRTDQDLDSPRVAEIIAPAILHRGELLRMGKAVVALPAVTPAERTPSE